MDINIGRKHITDDRTLIIAEIGSNWKTQEDCVRSIQKAAEYGADCVKFQLFNWQSLYGLSESRRQAESWYNAKAELPVEWLSSLRAECDNNQVELMISCFGPDLVRMADPYLNCHKIASSEITNTDLLEEVGSHGKPVFVSTGAATYADIENALAVLRGNTIILNYCVGAYPAKATDLFVIEKLKKFGHPVAISDHSMDYTYIPRAAVMNHGCCAIEKHVNFCKGSSADSHHSLAPVDFKRMVDYIRGRKESDIGPTGEEHEMIMKHKRRLVAIADIKKGDDFGYNVNVAAKRSLKPDTTGANPFAARSMHGTQASRDIKAGECVAFTDFE